jgi:hypothetical protein
VRKKKKLNGSLLGNVKEIEGGITVVEGRGREIGIGRETLGGHTGIMTVGAAEGEVLFYLQYHLWYCLSSL